METRNWPIEQSISAIHVGGHDESASMVIAGLDGITRIEATTKAGSMADIPYLRVWAGDKVRAEFCQHQIIGVFYDTDDTTAAG